ncbi:hypothetical protein DFH07DRAFT_775930 [Mycena maculata]|uniref:Uncharacterized protein n=1 Tax=Mycena maculata TaxID=230809 RepID=A0AAD7N6I8_9AGAR|nr:hypothetical protein DFH07DRAFT_775930 [Mycena maculata]
MTEQPAEPQSNYPSFTPPTIHLPQPSPQTVNDTNLFDADSDEEDVAGGADELLTTVLPRVLDYLGTVPQSALLAQEDGPNYVQIYQIPTLQAWRTMKDNSEVAKRRQECVEKGALGLNKPYLKQPSCASRRLRYEVFKEELSMLDSIMVKLERNEARTDEAKDGSSYVVQNVYRFESEPFKIFMRLLFNRREIAIEAFQLSGTVIPSLPVLGVDGDHPMLRFHLVLVIQFLLLTLPLLKSQTLVVFHGVVFRILGELMHPQVMMGIRYHEK